VLQQASRLAHIGDIQNLIEVPMKIALQLLLAALLTALPKLVTIEINVEPLPTARCQPAKTDTPAAFQLAFPLDEGRAELPDSLLAPNLRSLSDGEPGPRHAGAPRR
jgi:hypothetical protein